MICFSDVRVTAQLVTADDLLLSMFPSVPEPKSGERRINLPLNSNAGLRPIAETLWHLCACKKVRLIIGGKIVDVADRLPIARALRTSRYRKHASCTLDM
jgi:hypothetical protein